MASTYTTSGVELIATGEQSGTWGNTTNDNWNIMDRMVNVAGDVSLSGTTHSLVVSDGSLSDGHYAVVNFTGSPSGTNTVTISPNDAKRVFFVTNSSGESVIMSQGSGSTVTIANGNSAIVYCDGAGSGAAVADFSSTLDFVSDQGIGSTVQAWDAQLDDIAALAATDGNFIVGDGTNWVVESGDTVLASIGVTATATEISLLDGVTWTLTDYNTLTATATELNLLDGVTGTLVTEAGTQTLTGKTLTSPAMTAPTISDGLTVDTEAASWTGTEALDPANGLVQEITLTGNVTTLTDSLEDGESVILHVDDGAAFTITWPTITWISNDGTAPTLQTTGDTVITVWKVGTTLYGFASNGA